jgi:8-oxo-dGTP pyrophosphatase MutT (NUDIX family)
MAVQPRLASTILLLRDRQSDDGTEAGIEVFMVRRVIQSDFMPDVYVFPGGSVSAGDRDAEQVSGVCASVAPSQADPEGRTVLGSGIRAAAIREVFEEAGVLLAYRDGQMLAIDADISPRFASYRQAFQQRQGSLVEMAQAEQLTLATDQLRYYAHWITPEGLPKRFDTHFFITAAPQQQEAAYDRLETSEGVWINPAQALAGYERGEFPLVFATIHQLRGLAVFSSVDEALAYTATHYVPTRMPILVQENGGARVYLPDDAANTWNVPEHMTKPKEA